MPSQFYPEMYCTALIISTSRLFPYFCPWSLNELISMHNLQNVLRELHLTRCRDLTQYLQLRVKTTDKSFSSYGFCCEVHGGACFLTLSAHVRSHGEMCPV